MCGIWKLYWYWSIKDMEYLDEIIEINENFKGEMVERE